MDQCVIHVLVLIWNVETNQPLASYGRRKRSPQVDGVSVLHHEDHVRPLHVPRGYRSPRLIVGADGAHLMSALFSENRLGGSATALIVCADEENIHGTSRRLAKKMLA